MKRGIKRIASAVITAALVIVIAACGAGGGSYTAKVVGHSVINPGTVTVTVALENTGTEPGTPDVTVQAHDEGYTYTGIEIATPTKPIQSGDTALISVPVTVTGNGAEYATVFTAEAS